MGLIHLLLCLSVVQVWGQTSEATTSVTAITTITTIATTAKPTDRPTVKPSPPDVSRVEVKGQTETNVTLQWSRVESFQTYELQFNNRTENITDGSDEVNYTVTSLSAGIKYLFTLYTVSEDDKSDGYDFSAVTAPLNAVVSVVSQTESSVTLQWDKVSNIATYELQFENKTKNPIFKPDDGPVIETIQYLNSGTKYSFTLFTVFENISSRGESISTLTRPRNAASVKAVSQNESHVTLTWDQVDGVTSYELKFEENVVNISALADDRPITHTVSDLSPATKYSFTLFSVLESLSSSGHAFSAVTAPVNVAGDITVTERSDTTVTLQWSKVAGISDYALQLNNEPVINITANKESQANKQPRLTEAGTGDLQTYQVENLKAGMEYDLTLFAVFEGVRSSGLKSFTVTKINCVTSEWKVSNTSIQANVPGLFNKATASNSFGTHTSEPGNQVSFTGLYPGSNYVVSLLYERDSETFPQCEHTLTIVPPDLSSWRCNYASGGYAISLSWQAPGVWSGVQVNVSGRSPQTLDTDNVTETEISGLQPAQTYAISVATLSGTRRSNSVSIICGTDPRGVIGGSVTAVLLLIVLVCLAVFILRRRPEILRPLQFGQSKLSSDKFKPVSIRNFPEHFTQLSADQNRGFSEEYEDFAPIGTEQTRRAATDLEVKNKNRFTNVLPYDWSRVKLTTLNDDRTSDYINANYMPGYGSSRQYIAAQGPLPSTVNDFWRMVWEQRVKGVVMVTNCVEGGRTKCEQYWPLDYTPCLYGDLLITVRSEHKNPDWTLRELAVKNKITSEERVVRHFHFTAWPDHGVPEGTASLIQFRGLIREHVETQGAGGGPTVVHCSAGVGRTGTLIALDVTLQQLEREKAVGIAAFVHKMRLSRPLMVQTEGQYIYLHQCILDTLEPKTKMPENLYENSDMIYANATALREFQKANTNV